MVKHNCFIVHYPLDQTRRKQLQIIKITVIVSLTIILIINIPDKCTQCAFIQAIIYTSNPSIIMMTNNLIININVHMLIEILSGLRKPSKQVHPNNHKHNFNTQHLKFIILSIMSLYVKITTAFIHPYIYG